MPVNQNNQKNTPKRKKIINFEKQIELVKKPNPTYNPDELIFALDIGTRTVVGIVGFQDKDKFKVISAEILEHKNRAMLDGQIHDIMQVAERAKEVKEKLEKKLGFTLTKVAIAAAGRVLKTCEVRVEREIEQGKEIDQEIISSIEMEAIQKAQLKLDEEIAKEEKTQFYCVGYSVISYFLNDYVITSPIGHKGRKVGIDVLATFLPHIVVDSLYTVMNKIGLEVVSLTLEPIAAINVTIPRDLRLLNLALVDIGAGTSDIAITKDGSVVAYAMAPIAGDELTERIAQHYLLDFNTAEKVKTSLSTKVTSVTFLDVLGRKQNIKSDEIMEVVKPSIELLALTISQKILEYNHKAPNAVFLIGGGSQIPGLTELIAHQLKLPNDRVVVRGRDIIPNIKFSGKKLSGPEAITPFGIAITAQMQKGQDFLSVTINGKKIRMFNSRKLTVADALILIGFNANQLIGRSGKSVTFELNGAKKVVRGEYGNAAEIFVNNKPGSLDTVLQVGDIIKVTPSADGRNADVKVSDFVKHNKTGNVYYNGKSIDLAAKILINRRLADLDNQISEGDIVQINELNTVNDFIKLSEIDLEEFEVLVNLKKVDLGYELIDKDKIELEKKSVSISERADETEKNQQLDTLIKEEVQESNNALLNATADKNSVKVIINGKQTLIKADKNQYIFVDIFNFIDFDLTKPQGNIILKLNGGPAAFTDVIKPGDVIDIFWEK